jgi:hypothetical protein
VMIGKCVELFRDMLAPTRHVAVFTNAADPLFAKLVLDEAECLCGYRERAGGCRCHY